MAVGTTLGSIPGIEVEADETMGILVCIPGCIPCCIPGCIPGCIPCCIPGCIPEKDQTKYDYFESKVQCVIINKSDEILASWW